MFSFHSSIIQCSFRFPVCDIYPHSALYQPRCTPKVPLFSCLFGKFSAIFLNKLMNLQEGTLSALFQVDPSKSAPCAFSRMVKSRTLRDWTAMITAYEQNGCEKEALELLQQMQ